MLGGAVIGESDGAFGCLSAFQKVMVQWSELHPFNGAHVCKISGPLRKEDLRRAVSEAFQRLGLGFVELAPDGLLYRHEPDRSPEVEMLSGGESPERALTLHVAEQLNLPFARPRCRPLRLSAIDSRFGYHYVNVTYDHWIADSVAIRLLLRHVLARYCGLEIPGDLAALQLYPATYRRVFADRLAGLPLVGALCRWSGGWLRAGRTAQVAHTSSSQMAVNYELYWAGDETVPQLVHLARGLDVSVNDVILAALARALCEFLPRRRRRGRPLEVALNTMVDARRDARVDLSNSFGTFMANYVIRCRRDEAMGLGALARCIAATTGPIKRQRRHLDSAIGMKLIGGIWPHLGAAARPRFLRWAMPLTAGVSNVVLRDPWIKTPGEGPVLDYFRAGPAAPVVPLLLTPTTWGPRLSVGATYRVTGFSRAKIDGIMAMFMDQIEHAGRHAKQRVDRTHGAPRRTLCFHRARNRP
jgi:hypothetical protein